MVITMQDYEEIRKRYLAGESQRSIVKRMGISRNTVKKHCEGNAVPWERKTLKRESTVLTTETVAFMLDCLEQDVIEGIKKQQHTARRIYTRLVEEKGFTGAESTVRAKVQELRDSQPKAFIPLEFAPGEALQVDWGETTVYFEGHKTVVNLFCARLCYSCKPVVIAYHKQNEESFLEAFVKVFEILGGVPKRVIFDNAKVAVKEGFGSYAKKQAGYSALCAHYGFDAVFCNPSEGHEKGLVEGLVGWARRNIMVPVPRIKDISELNELIIKRCKNYDNHQIKGKAAKVGTMFEIERKSLHPLPGYRFETAKTADTRVNTLSTVRFKTNSYSVSVSYVGKTVAVKGYPEIVEVYYEGKLIASHNRCFGKHQKLYHLEHYMPLLKQRGRAILDAAPVKQNIPPEVYAELEKNSGNYSRMITILQDFIKPEEPKIKDIVKIRTVDLSEYDFLGGGP